MNAIALLCMTLAGIQVSLGTSTCSPDADSSGTSTCSPDAEESTGMVALQLTKENSSTIELQKTSRETLDLRQTSSYEMSYTDAGTGSKRDLRVWRPKLFSNEFRLMYTQVTDHWDTEGPTVVVKESTKTSTGALKPPVHFVCKWTDKGTGGDKDATFWQPVAPTGYTCLSDVAIYRWESKPGITKPADLIDPQFRCVHNSLTIQTELGQAGWTDAGSGGTYDAAVWSIKNSDGMRVGAGSGDVPDYEQRRLKAFTGNLFRDLKMVYSIINDKDFDEPDQKYQMTRGLTTAVGSSVTLSAEFTAEVTAAASLGVEGIASSSLSATIGSKFGTSTTFSRMDTSSELSTATVTMKLPKRTKVELYQVIATDAENGHGSFTILSNHYLIKNVKLDQ